MMQILYMFVGLIFGAFLTIWNTLAQIIAGF